MGNKAGNPRYHGLTPEQRLFKRINKTETCWNWTGSKNRGYGKIRVSGKGLYAHRISYELHVGPIPDGMWVLHRCDNPACVRPDHLFLGTPLANAQDRANKGRNNAEARSGEKHFSKTRPELLARGSANGSAKLTEDGAKEILLKHAAGISKKTLAIEYGVSRANIGLIVNGKAWKHLAELA